MIESQAQVLHAEGDWVVVQAQRQTGCQSCSSQSGCGTSSLAKLFHIQTLQLRLNNPKLELKAGDWVLIGTEESLFLAQALWSYLPALLGFLLGLALGQVWLQSQAGWIFILGLFGSGLGFLVTRVHLRRQGERYLPQLLKKMELSLC